MRNTEFEYILATNKVAMIFYKESKEILMESRSFDFMIYKFSKRDEVLEDNFLRTHNEVKLMFK